MTRTIYAEEAAHAFFMAWDDGVDFEPALGHAILHYYVPIEGQLLHRCMNCGKARQEHLPLTDKCLYGAQHWRWEDHSFEWHYPN